MGPVVEVWHWRLIGTPDDHARAAATLSPDEAARAARFHFVRDRDRFVLARAGVRRVLGALLSTPPASLAFVYGASGKPALAQETGLHFNLSHTADHAALAVADGFALGIDIEQPRTIDPGVAERFFAPNENAALRQTPPSAWNAAFFRCWTRKEAYVKAVGDGLLIPLDSFEVSLAADAPAVFHRVGDDKAEAARWQLAHLDLAPDCLGAIAARRTGWRVRLRGPA